MDGKGGKWVRGKQVGREKEWNGTGGGDVWLEEK